MPKIAQYKEKILNEFENRFDEWTYVDFERRLGEVKGGSSYHDAKTVILDGYDLGKWPNTIKRYLFTNYKSHGNVSSEFTRIFNEILALLTAEEKEYWALGL